MCVEIIGNVDVSKLQSGLHPDEINLIGKFRDEGGLVVLTTDPGVIFEKAKFTIVDETPVIILRVKNDSIEPGLIVHEMVHYEQWVRGDLRFKDEKIIWRGVMDKGNIRNPVHYWNTPWEQEAYEKQASWLEKEGIVNKRKFLATTKGAIYGTHWVSIALLGLLLIVTSFTITLTVSNPTIITTIVNLMIIAVGWIFMNSGIKYWKDQRHD